MVAPVTEFYDRLGPEYRHNMGWDWDAQVRQEGASLDRFLANHVGRSAPWSLLDCSCGIGTQAIGLALLGHKVHATDLSPVSIETARQASTDFGVDMTFGVANFCDLGAAVTDTFDVVITCDNSIAHCLRDEDLAAAMASMKTRLEPDGLLLLSLRDYDALVADKLCFNNEHIHDRPDGRRIVFQVWDWADDGRTYRVHQFLIKETDGQYDVKHFETELRVLLRDDVMTAVRNAGFDDVTWHDPESSGYYQSIVTARSR